MNGRQLVQVVIRAVCILTAAWAMVIIASRIASRLIYTGSFGRLLERPVFEFREQLILILPPLLIAVLLWLGQRQLARLIVPRFGRTCPECGYDLRKLKGSVCPECGAEVRAPQNG